MFLKNHTQKIFVPILFENIPEDLIVMNDDNLNISLSLEGRGMDILFFKIAQPFYKLNAKDFRYGKNIIELQEENLEYPQRIKIDLKAMNYTGFDWIMLDRLVTKTKPIQLKYASTKDEDFFYKNKILTNEVKVKLKGPLSLLNEIKKIETQKISKKMLRDGKVKVSLIKPVGKVEFENNDIVFDVLQKKIITKTISLIPVKFPINENISIIPQKVSIMVRGPEDIVNKLDKRKISAHIEINKAKSNDFVDIKFDIPTGVKLIDHTPQKIQIIRND
ncbi:MAG: hypothetical protein K8S23_17410 [Candidatus Cloacimonetes bacterium]|nr:hypothetical protein [Candidatus Cloacimonadota bacterium]